MSLPKFLCSSLDFSCNSDFLVATVLLNCFFKLVSRPSFSYRDSIYVLVLIVTLSCIIVISVATQKVCRDRVMSPLSLFPCCRFIIYVVKAFLLGMFCMSRPQYVMPRQRFFYMWHIFLSRPSFFCPDITCLPLACLCVMTHFPCRNRTFMCSVDFYVAT